MRQALPPADCLINDCPILLAQAAHLHSETVRIEDMQTGFGVSLHDLQPAALPEPVESWLDGLLERPAVTAELEVVRGLRT